MKKIFAPLLSIVGLLVAIFVLSYVVPPVAWFLEWYFILKEEITAPITTGQAVIIDLITHLITYSFVGAVFGLFRCWDKDAMRIVYVIISEIVSLGLALLLRAILDYYWILFIILGVFLIGMTVIYIINKKKEKRVKDND